ncbi:twin-arginine translocase TatA/TatE family subunit [Kangiella geojedonensis]|uniref:Sec-independent protein translocase protein TatA n=1 Tax=Kangiella geojedonensis TaxID=914150 RepID=A0A0F6RB77_9GAMM|nr:twin-arginine translocase TatA/TatE family subunit [Kangiella geojedonensis]AKE51318.1 hypothetical protein TQ33_0330 [Kangiella geojedonensis]
MFSKFGMWELIIILVIILLLFGTKKLRNAGGDVGAAFKNFKKAFKDEDDKKEETSHLNDNRDNTTQDANFSESKDTDSNKKS